MTTWIAMIRAIGPATHKKMTMQQLRTCCEGEGLENVRTYIASGNLLFNTRQRKADVKSLLSGILALHALDNDVFLRTPKELESVIALNPFPQASRDRPNHMLVTFMEKACASGNAKALDDYAGPERVYVNKKEIYIDYLEGVARSRLSPRSLEKLAGQPGTARNWNTVNKLLALAME